jgi:DNA helicase-2/ATP-dependent DNA helicase PcrA
VDTTKGELTKLVEDGVHWVRQEDGSWQQAESGGAVSRKEGQQDHRLPEITSLISREQFRAITHPDSRTIILQGGAGSGKTTVGLHRIAYLAYQNPERFRPERLLVVMFNRSLQKYISRVLPDLGIKPGVQVETYHSWSGKLFKRLGMAFSYQGSAPEAVTRLKKHPLILSLIECYLADLLNKSRQWLQERLGAAAEFSWKKLTADITAAPRFSDFLQLLSQERIFPEPQQAELWQGWRSRLSARLNDHKLDLHSLLTDHELLQAGWGTDLHPEEKALDQLIHWQTNLQNDNRIDYADAGLLLYLMQLKGVNAARPRYAHIMVDEAQDLSQVELATLLAAADEQQSLTICGDMAQKIKGEVTFTDAAGFGDFIHRRQADLGLEQVCAETLMVGYRATRPIMELAWQVLGEKASLVVAREGPPVRVIRTPNYEATLEEAQQILTAYRRERPQALIAVVCRYIADADRVCTSLQRLGLGEIRRHAREDFSFQPGIVVTNAHQVKGLEFTAVMIINPCTQNYRDDRAGRMLLHVVITRAADQLWIIGHQPLAYGLDRLGA